MKNKKSLYCLDCGEPAAYVRHSQFAGSHPFCDKHARKERNFGKTDEDSFWIKIPANKIAPKHKTAVEGYEDKLDLLSERLHRLRYDKVSEFYRHSALELQKQAKKDRARGRNQLADLLDVAAASTESQQALFALIWNLCKPHMKKTD